MQLKLTPSYLNFHTVLLIMPFFLWGTAMVAMKGVIPHSTPLFMAGFRLMPAGILLLLAGAYRKRQQPNSTKAWLWIILFALIDGTLFQGFLASGLVRTTAGLGSVMIDSQPLAVALLSALLFGEIIGLFGWIGLSLGVMGISCIGLPKEWIMGVFDRQLPPTFDIDLLFSHGEWLMLLAALSMAIGTVMIRYIIRYVDPVIATGWHMILGSIPLFLGSAIWETNQYQEIDLSGWLLLGYSTVFGSAIAYGLFFYFASSGNLTSLSSLTFLTPVFALLFGSFFLTENLDFTQWMGVGLTLVSIGLINQRERINSLFRNQDHPKNETGVNCTATTQPLLRGIDKNAKS